MNIPWLVSKVEGRWGRQGESIRTKIDAFPIQSMRRISRQKDKGSQSNDLGGLKFIHDPLNPSRFPK